MMAVMMPYTVCMMVMMFMRHQELQYNMPVLLYTHSMMARMEEAPNVDLYSFRNEKKLKMIIITMMISRLLQYRDGFHL
jgi:hypothetical protein